ncbi:MAG: polysaccharide pyruvyl transferase family protein [Bryobacterales bacterium]|nr:polysaccharide pyruvyl transferase family protein [Bryobacterales bacterium]
MPDPPRIFISGYYGYSNPGDEAILSVLLAELRAHLPNPVISVISGAPAETERTHGVHAVLWSDPLAIAHAVRDAGLVITGGGGIFHDYGGLSEDGLLTEGNWGIGFHVTAGLLAALFSKPHVIYAAGVGPLFSGAARRYTRAVCETASLITVRDDASRQLLEDIGVPPASIRVTADPAFLLPPAPLPAGIPADSTIGVAIRHWDHGVAPEQWETECAAGLDAFLDRRPGQVLFLPFQQFSGKQEDDLAVAVRVRGRMRHNDRAHILDGAYTPAQKAAILGACRLVIGMRLHSLIFSLNARVPPVALIYDEKVRQLIHRAGLDAFGIAMPELRASLLAAKMEQALDTPPADPAPFVALARENTAAVLDVLRRGPDAGPGLRGEPLELVRDAVFSLLAAQKQLRSWLSDQKTNYEYQISLQREQMETSASELRQARASLEKKDASLADWQAYGDEMHRRLEIYRRQRAWRAMLAIRKAYTLLACQGWSGRFRFLPWLFSLLRGRGGIEGEQLEFPLRPKPRE